MPIIDAIAVTARDMEKSVAFYSYLGFDFGDADMSAQHIEPKRRDGEPRLMIDSAELAQQLNDTAPRPATHAQFALLCDSPAEVDAIAKKITDAGYDMKVAPWDAFWGQRYATVIDPDGYLIDLFAPIS